ncbi:MAG: DUF362 domain-containing protein [Calditrichaceae bacterium]|nr:DUF362 domain-containing protein [Calditrichaceae bacterium]
MKNPSKTRRQFIKDSSAAAAGLLFVNFWNKSFGQTQGRKSRVVLIRHEQATNALQKPQPDVVQKMLDDAIVALMDINDPIDAWKKIITPDDIVGIKSNVWNNLPTTTAVENAIKTRILNVGVKETYISINDRSILRDPVFKQATALINARPLRTHHWAGVGTLIKNYIMFVNSPWEYHDDSCADLAKIWFLPHVKGKTRLNVLVMFTPLFHGIGPHHFSPQYTWVYNGLIIGFDPVAVDAVGVRILQEKRNQYFGENRPLNPPPKHIFLADNRHHLGTADPDKIELIKLGWKKNILI